MSENDQSSPGRLMPNEIPVSPTAAELGRNEPQMKSFSSTRLEPSAANRSIGESAPEALSPRSKEPEAGARLAPEYKVMFVLVAFCGFGTLSGFLLATTRRPGSRRDSAFRRRLSKRRLVRLDSTGRRTAARSLRYQPAHDRRRDRRRQRRRMGRRAGPCFSSFRSATRSSGSPIIAPSRRSARSSNPRPRLPGGARTDGGLKFPPTR